MPDNNNQTNTTSRFSRKQWVGVTIAVIVVIILALLMRGKTSAPTTPETSTTPDTTSTEGTTTKTPSVVSYDQMLGIYKDRTVTVANNCVVTPEEQKLDMGTMLLINNTSDKTQVIGFGSDTYTITSKHYRTIKLAKDGRFLISCDGKPTHSAVTVLLK